MDLSINVGINESMLSCHSMLYVLCAMSCEFIVTYVNTRSNNPKAPGPLPERHKAEYNFIEKPNCQPNQERPSGPSRVGKGGGERPSYTSHLNIS